MERGENIEDLKNLIKEEEEENDLNNYRGTALLNTTTKIH